MGRYGGRGQGVASTGVARKHHQRRRRWVGDGEDGEDWEDGSDVSRDVVAAAADAALTAAVAATLTVELPSKLCDVAMPGLGEVASTCTGGRMWPRRMCLAVAFSASESGVSEADVWLRVSHLETIVPGLATASLVAKGPDAMVVVGLAMGDHRRLAANVLVLRSAFPTANVATMAGRAPGLLAMPSGELEAAAARTSVLMASVERDAPDAICSYANEGGVDAAVERNPALLDVALLESALAVLRDSMPESDGAKVLQRNPSMLFINSERREGIS
jgi:hypothetical protein